MTSHDVVYPNTVIDKRIDRIALWTGRILSGVAALALFADSFGKLVEVQPVIDGTLALGYPRDSVFMLGVILFTCVLTYVIPRTSVLGAILLTAFLGGAVATHVRVGSPLFTHILVPTYVAAFVGWPAPARPTAARIPALHSAGATDEGVMTRHASSKDGTRIAYERSGSAGPCSC